VGPHTALCLPDEVEIIPAYLSPQVFYQLHHDGIATLGVVGQPPLTVTSSTDLVRELFVRSTDCRWKAVGGYLQMYVLAALEPARHQVQILHEYDSCCFRAAGLFDSIKQYVFTAFVCFSWLCTIAKMVSWQ
jgi:hypothetical protein